MWTRCCAACKRVLRKARLLRSHPLRVRLGMVVAMAIVIEFYVPEKFRKLCGKWIPPEQRGTIISLSRAGKEVGMT
jgi:hypothetical protein